MKNEDLIIKLHKKAFTVDDIVLYLNVKAHYVKKYYEIIIYRRKCQPK